MILQITLLVWLGVVVGKIFNVPGIREFTWGQLFLVPVAILVYRLILLLITWVIIPVGGVYLLYLFVEWSLANLPLATGYNL